MKLSTDRKKPVEEPRPEQIREALLSLAPDGSGFAILEQSGQYFMQAGGSAQEGFVLEYRDGSDARQFRADPVGTSLEDVVAAFSDYARGDESFKARFTWVPALG